MRITITMLTLVGCMLLIPTIARAEHVATQPQAKTEAPKKNTAGKPASVATKPAPKEKDLHEMILAGGNFEPIIEETDRASINWTTGEILASGTARIGGYSRSAMLKAKRAARLIAARNAVLALHDLRPGTDGRFTNLKTGNISAEVIVKHFKVKSGKLNRKQRTYTTTMSLPIHGISGAVSTLGLQSSTPAGDMIFVGEGDADVIIIDARLSRFKPCATLTIKSATGRVLFSAANVPANERMTYRPAVYVYRKHGRKINPKTKFVYGRPIVMAQNLAKKTGQPEAKLERITGKMFKKPLILNAVPNSKAPDGTVVVSQLVQRELMTHGEARELLRKGKVIVVTDSLIKAK